MFATAQKLKSGLNEMDDCPLILTFVYISAEPGYFLLKLYDGMGFSSPDMDIDRHATKHCAFDYQSSWWFRFCSFLTPNGDYITPGTISDQSKGMGGIVHGVWRGLYSLKSTKLMFRRL